MVKKALFLTIALLCTGCMRSYLNPAVHLETLRKESESLAVMKLSTKRGRFEDKCTFVLTRLSPLPSHSYYVRPSFSQSINPWDRSYLFLMLKPGLYAIHDISWTSSNTKFTSALPAVEFGGKLNYGAFEVTPDSCFYIGDLTISCTPQKRFLIERVDQFDKAEKAFIKKFPSITKPLKKAHFLPQGTNIPSSLPHKGIFRQSHKE